MKRLLALSLMLISAGAMAQNSSGKGCRVLIGEDWIPMGATTISGCLKYAEAAATPGERQFAQFGSTQLSYKDGQSFQSNDDGKTWQPIRGSSEGSVGSLNTLRSGPEEGDKQNGKTEAASTPAPAPTRAAQATPSTPVMPELEAPVPLDDTAPAAPAGSRSAQVAPPAPAMPYRPEPTMPSAAAPSASAPYTPPSSGSAADQINQSVPRGCQVHIGEKWQVTPVSSVEECGRVLVNMAQKSGAKSSQAYWAGNYLFYTNGQLYHSTNGQDWHTLR